MTADPNLVPSLAANTFDAGSTVFLYAATITTALTLPKLTNVNQYQYNTSYTSIQISNGGNLTFASGTNLWNYNGNTLVVNNGGTLTAATVNFGSGITVTINNGGIIASSGSRYDSTLQLVAGAILQGFTGNKFAVTSVTADPNLVPSLAANTFDVGSTVFLYAATITTTLTLPKLTNVNQYQFSGSYITIQVNAGGSLTIAAGNTLANYNGNSIGVNTGGVLNLRGVSIGADVIYGQGSGGTVQESVFNGTNPHFYGGTSVSVRHNDFSNVTQIFLDGLSTATFSLAENYWGVAAPSSKVTDHAISATRPTATGLTTVVAANTFGGTVFVDSNDNGYQDFTATEVAGVSGVAVNLVDVTKSNSVIQSTTTDSFGDYYFAIPSSSLTDQYSVTFTKPAGYADFTIKNAPGVDVWSDSNAYPISAGTNVGTTDPIQWSNRSFNFTYDAGLLTALNAPSLTSVTTASVTSTSAILGANVITDGGSPITERGILYSLTSANSNPQVGGAGVTKLTATGTTGVFTVNAGSLTPGAAYSFVAYATNGIGTGYTSPVSTFTTLASPTVITPTSTSITSNSATLGGNVSNDGGSPITERGILYALTSANGNPQLGGTGVTKLTVSGTTGVFTVNASSLTIGAAYSFVAYATNGIGTTYTSPVSTFATLATPTVTTPTMTNITNTSATLGGNVSSDGGNLITERGVLYALTSANGNPQLGGTGVTKLTASGTTGVFTVNASSLAPGAGYSFVAYATNSSGTTYTAPVSTFTTLASPTVTSPTKSNISGTTATLGGTVSSDGGSPITERGVLYALTSANGNPQLGGTGVTKLTASGTTGVFTVNLTGLTPQAGYSFVAFATNGIGTTYTSPVSTFTTLVAPIVNSPTSASIGSTTASLGGNVVNDGGSPITERGVLYTLTTANSNPQLGGTGVTKVIASGTTGVFTVSTTGLTPGAAYSCVAYATNSVGTTYTSVSTFTTLTVSLPTITNVYDPSGNPVQPGSTLKTSVNSLTVAFSNNLNTVTGGANSVTNPSNWLLFRYGSDVSYEISGITFSFNSTTLQYNAVLSFALPIFPGGYELVARQTIQDVTGRILGGDPDGTAGDYRLNFYVGQTINNVTDVAPVLYQIEDTPLNAAATLNTPITSSLLVFDADSNNWTGATIQIAINYRSDQDVLGFVNTPNITGSWNATTGTLTLTGTDTVSNYRTALHNVTYHNTSATPNTSVTRTVDFQSTDGLLPSNVVTRDVSVMASSIPAVISNVNGTGTFYEGDPAFALAAGLTITDPNVAYLSSATVTFTNWQGEDRLNFNNIFGLQHTFTQDLVAHTATFTITGQDFVDHYQTLLRSVIYWDVSANPVTTPRVASFSVTDGLSTSNVVTRNIVNVAVNQAPTLNAIESSPLAYKANDPAFPSLPISSTLLVGDPDSNNLTKATVQITSGYENDANGNDVLSFANQLGITGAFNATTGTLTLMGTSSVSNYRTALRSVTFSTSGAAVSTANRTLTIVATDDYSPTPANSLAATRTVTVLTTNSPPALTGIPSAFGYVRGSAAVSVAPSLLILDSDSINMAGATVQIGSNYQSGQDVLAVTTGFGITGSFNATTGTLTLTGISSISNYQTVLQSLTYKTNSAGASTATRTISFTVNDGLANSSTVANSVTLS